MLISYTSLLGALLFGGDVTSRWFRAELAPAARAALCAQLGLAPGAHEHPLPGVASEDDPLPSRFAVVRRVQTQTELGGVTGHPRGIGP